MGRWAKFRHLSRAERWLLVQAIVLLPFVAMGLRVLGFSKIHSVLSRLAPINKDRSVGQVASFQAGLAARIVGLAANHGLYRASCLPKSITLWWLLQCQGIESDLRIGVRKDKGCLEAHAWVEHCGLPLNDSGDV